MLTLMCFEPISKKYIAIDEKDIPVILDDAGASTVKLAYVNNSKYIISNIVISATAPGAGNFTSYASQQSVLVEDAVFTSGFGHSYTTNSDLEELHPGGMLFLYAKCDYSTNVNIDYDNFSLDMAYTKSLITLQNILTFFEFTEANKATNLLSSVGAVTGTASNAGIIKGNGFAYLRKATDTISFTTSSLSDLTLYMKLMIFDIETNGTIFESTDFTIMINTDRKLVIYTATESVVVDYVMESTEREYNIAISLSNINDIEVIIDGTIALAVSVADEALGTGTGYIIGGGINCDISSVALYGTAYSYNEKSKIVYKVISDQQRR